MTESAGRAEAFSDGVFAIAITLLILEIRVPHVEHGLWAGLLALWPSYVAFLMSFVVILIMWVNHHELLRMVRGVNYPFLFANGLLLLTVTFVPFPTAVLAANLATTEAKPAANRAVRTSWASTNTPPRMSLRICRMAGVSSSIAMIPPTPPRS